MNRLRHDYTTGLTWCRKELHVIPASQEPTRDGRRCRECRRTSLARAQMRYRSTAKGVLEDVRNGAKRRSSSSRPRRVPGGIEVTS